MPELRRWPLYICHACDWRMASEQHDFSCEQCGSSRKLIETVEVVPESDLAALQERLEEVERADYVPLENHVRSVEALRSERDSLAQNQLTPEEAALLVAILRKLEVPQFEPQTEVLVSATTKLARLSQSVEGR
jgi:hypothetical protein